MRTTLIMVAFGAPEATRAALVEGARALAGDLCRVVVVDNCPEEPFEAPDLPVPVTVVASGANLGFARAANEGARSAEGDVLVFLNPDVSVPGGDLMPLAAALAADPGLGCVGPVLVGPDGSPRPSGGVFHYRPGRLARWFGRDAVPTPGADGVAQVDWVAGTCLAVRRSAFESVDGFDEAYYMYFEDVDLCRRLLDAGYRSGLVPSVVVGHRGSSGYERLPPGRKEDDYRRSRRLFLERHGGLVSRLIAAFLDLLSAGRYHRAP